MNKETIRSIQKFRKYIEEVRIRYTAEDGFYVQVQTDRSPVYFYFVCKNNIELIELISKLTEQ